MNALEELQFLPSSFKLVPQNMDSSFSLYKLDCPNCQSDIKVYKISHGIHLIFFDYECTTYEFKHAPYDNILQINYCLKGRIGWKLKNGEYMYLGEGDLSLHMMDNCSSSTLKFPLKYSHNIAIMVNLDEVAAKPPEIILDASINISDYKRKFFKNDSFLVMPGREEFEHIFSEICSLPRIIKVPCLKLKIQELLLFLNTIDINTEKQREKYLSPQVEIIKKIHKHLISNLQQRETIEELSKKYLINTSTLKSIFKGVYGKPIATYMKEYRIHKAAILLRQNNSTVADIAKQVGYENASKFSTAFKKIMNLSPNEYRLQYKINPNDIISIENN